MRKYNNIKKKKILIKNIILFLIFNLLLAAVLSPFMVFYGPFDALKTLAVGSILTSRHPQVVKAFLSDQEIDRIIHKYDGQESTSPIAVQNVSTNVDGITIEDVKGNGFKGKVMLVKNPKWVKLAVTKHLKVAGERVSDLVKDTGAIAGINAGGFYDPDGKGNGGYPDGLTVHEGKIVHSNIGDKSTDIVALDKDGKLFVGQITADELQEKNIQEAVSFYPALIKDGKRTNFQDGTAGIAPRTAIGQKADGTIILVVIDGRQPTWSLGAWLSDLYHIFQKYGAVNAANLDGGSSSEMVYQGKVINKLWDSFGERYLSTAFVIVPG